VRAWSRSSGRAKSWPPGQIPFTPRAKKVIELSLREALSLNEHYIGTEHILLGIVRENEGIAARILLNCGADADTVRDEVIEMLRRAPAPPAKPAKMPSSMAATEKSPSEQAAEIQKLIDDAQDRLSQAKWALQTLVERLDAHEKETKG
jgi:ATP-dependent Clp protease ATP-binding subunit ClpC